MWRKLALASFGMGYAIESSFSSACSFTRMLQVYLLISIQGAMLWYTTRTLPYKHRFQNIFILTVESLFYLSNLLLLVYVLPGSTY